MQEEEEEEVLQEEEEEEEEEEEHRTHCCEGPQAPSPSTHDALHAPPTCAMQTAAAAVVPPPPSSLLPRLPLSLLPHPCASQDPWTSPPLLQRESASLLLLSHPPFLIHTPCHPGAPFRCPRTGSSSTTRSSSSSFLAALPRCFALLSSKTPGSTRWSAAG